MGRGNDVLIYFYYGRQKPGREQLHHKEASKLDMETVRMNLQR
jgi:hypothetical protein